MEEIITKDSNRDTMEEIITKDSNRATIVEIIFCKLYNLCVGKEENTVCSGEFECKKGCENCAGRIFLKHK